MPGKLEDRLIAAMVRAIHDWGDLVFTTSQRDVPVDKGTLKKSGILRKLPNGIEIVYRTPYAWPVHEGVPEHDERVRQHFVRSHLRRKRRQARRRTIMVRSHLRGPFTRHMSERKARPWLRNAVERHYPRLSRMFGQRLALEFGSR